MIVDRLAVTLAVCVVCAVAACHSSTSTAPAHVTSGPALPPSSGTVIGILVDEATTLHLRDDQLDQLRAIDAALVVRNDRIDGEVRDGEHPAAPRGPRRHQSGMGGSAKGRMVPPPPPGARDLIRNPQQLQDERTSNNREALTQAFAILDPDQTSVARRLLEDHGVPVSSEPATTPEPGADPPPASPALP
ncbi:MAG: hypothetical protein H6Q90_3296 [Deltaproteobacteria bacterium]|nr:hypothetical protein [Deltaproteobacteria bacterium]